MYSGGPMNTNHQIVNAQNMGWIGAAGLASIFFSLVVLWAVNDKYAFIALQLQLMTDRANRAEQRLELLEVKEQSRQQKESER
jgi:hypothetical protein